MASDGPPDVGDEDKERRLGEVVAWAIGHLVEETNFGVSLVVVGDPEVLAGESALSPDDLGGESWRMVETPAGRTLAVGRRGGADGPWLWVTRSSDGPLETATIQSDTWTDEAWRESGGELVLPSGRLVIADPETVSRWGPAVAPDGGMDVQSKTGWDDPTPTYLGLVVVIRVEPGTRCPIELARTQNGQLHAVTIKFPKPNWLPANLRP